MQLLAARILYSVSFVIAMALSLLIPDASITLPVVLTLLLLAGWIVLGLLHRKGISPAWSITIATLNFLLLVPELGLRAANFHYESGVQFGWPRPRDFLTFQADRDLLWKYPPRKNGANSFGFLEKEITLAKPKNVYRILFLGDSVTEQGYPALVQARLNGAGVPPHKQVECINLGVSGYSSFQGKRVAELYGDRLQGDLAVIYFGWNDHWQAYGSVDSKKVIRTADYEGWRKQFLLFYHNSCLLQWCNLKVQSMTNSKQFPLHETRVSESEYAQNLSRIHRVFSSRGKRVVLLTAPTSLYKVPMPDYLVERGFVPSVEVCKERHRRYNRIVREIAVKTQSPLLDLESYFDQRSAEKLGRIFVDGIHFSEPGLRLLSDRVALFLQQEVLSVPDSQALPAP